MDEKHKSLLKEIVTLLEEVRKRLIIMTGDPDEPLGDVNMLLEEVKNKLNKNYKVGDKFRLTIEDKWKGDTVNDPVEDVELKIRSIRLTKL